MILQSAARSGNRERDRAAGIVGPAHWILRNGGEADWRHGDRNRRAGDRPEGISNDGVISAAVAQRQAGNAKARVVRARDVSAVFSPLISQRRGSASINCDIELIELINCSRGPLRILKDDRRFAADAGRVLAIHIAHSNRAIEQRHFVDRAGEGRAGNTAANARLRAQRNTGTSDHIRFRGKSGAVVQAQNGLIGLDDQADEGPLATGQIQAAGISASRPAPIIAKLESVGDISHPQT